MPHTPEKRREYAREYYKKWNADNPEKIREYGRRYYYNNLETCRERGRVQAAKDKDRYARFKKRHPEAGRWQHIKTRYGISKERWMEMYEEQNG